MEERCGGDGWSANGLMLLAGDGGDDDDDADAFAVAFNARRTRGNLACALAFAFTLLKSAHNAAKGSTSDGREFFVHRRLARRIFAWRTHSKMMEHYPERART